MLKYKVIVIVVIFLVLFNFSTTSIPVSNLVEDKTVCLDAGHGGIDPGAISGKTHEKDINLKITLLLGNMLEQDNYKVIYTRVDDTDLAPKHYKERKKPDLAKRVKLINNSNCFMYVSIHLNASPASKFRGPQMYFDDINKDNEKIAEIFRKTFRKYVSTTRESEELKKLYLYRRVKVPGILAEIGFLSNPNDKYLLLQDWYQKKIATILKEGILEYEKEVKERLVK